LKLGSRKPHAATCALIFGVSFQVKPGRKIHVPFLAVGTERVAQHRTASLKAAELKNNPALPRTSTLTWQAQLNCQRAIAPASRQAPKDGVGSTAGRSALVSGSAPYCRQLCGVIPLQSNSQLYARIRPLSSPIAEKHFLRHPPFKGVAQDSPSSPAAFPAARGLCRAARCRVAMERPQHWKSSVALLLFAKRHSRERGNPALIPPNPQRASQPGSPPSRGRRIMRRGADPSLTLRTQGDSKGTFASINKRYPRHRRWESFSQGFRPGLHSFGPPGLGACAARV
jgi:hypothetical protein